MDKSAIKNFATSARKKLIEGVRQKAYGLGISDKEIKPVEELPDGKRIEINNEYRYLTNTESKNREKLIEQIELKGYEQVMEEVAYTWFNRIIAIRFMEVNDYLPTGVRVLSSEEASKIEPDAVTEAHSLIDELDIDRDTVFKFQDNNDSEGLFKYILIKQCNALGKIMPVMFEKIEDYTELLLPDNLLVEGSVVRDLVSNIIEEDFKDQVEIIGWLYQYYISEKKDEVFADLKKNKKITKENIPAATQLFTPDWIVKYMVENSLGRLWLEGHPNEELQSSWKYYLEEAKQEEDVEKEFEKIREESRKLSPEDITVLDPSMGSGHILVYAFDVLYQIYLSAGYSEREIPRLILEKNIYGLDIDDRAGQLAYFALMMKARSYSRRIFRDMERNPISLNICSIQDSNGLTKEDIEYFADGDESLQKDIEYLVEVFTDAKEYGSILEVKEVDFEGIENRLAEIEEDIADLFSKESSEKIIEKVPNIISQCKIMSRKYDVCTTNPPYMGKRKSMNDRLANYVDEHYSISKMDLFSIFMTKNIKFTKETGYLGFMTPNSWLFINSYLELRKFIIENKDIVNLIQLDESGFEDAAVSICTFVLSNKKLNKDGTYIRLTNFKGADEQKLKVLEAIEDKSVDYIYTSNTKNYYNVPDYRIAYWISEIVAKTFNSKLLGDYIDVKQGMATSDNDRFLKLWYEVNIDNVGFNICSLEEASNSKLKWFPYNKGGKRRKWYGNNEYVVNWESDGKEVKEYAAKLYKSFTRTIKNMNYYFKKSITWSDISGRTFAARSCKGGFLFDVKGSSAFPEDDKYNHIIALMNSKILPMYIEVLNPTTTTQVGDLKQVPVKNVKEYMVTINKNVEENIYSMKLDWDSFETSWDFKKHPIIEFKSNNIENSFKNWEEFTEKQFNQLKVNEEELNRIFIDIYGLQDELTPEVEDKDITIRKADRERDIKSFISYAVGCMMGRYSLDEEGLAFAGGDFDINKYKIFKSDEDAIIPITDAEYFEDDIVSKFVEFVKVVFGEDSLEENLNYIADTECFKRKANESSRDCLRRYFLKGFMEDHLKVYQKRPIYWMFDSGKQNGFKALIYMHRYNESMVAKIRTDYLHTLQRKYESEIDRLDNDMNSEVVSAKEKATAKKRKEALQKQLIECVAYDQVIAHIANQRIKIDLDDGIKVNYQKFQGVEVPQGDGKKDLKADLLFKVKM